MVVGVVAVAADVAGAPFPAFDDDFFEELLPVDWGALAAWPSCMGVVVVACSVGFAVFAEAVLASALFDAAAELELGELALAAEELADELEGAELDAAVFAD